MADERVPERQRAAGQAPQTEDVRAARRSASSGGGREPAADARARSRHSAAGARHVGDEIPLPARRLIRELHAISSCNQTLLRAEDEQTLLNEICGIVCDVAGYRLAWVGFAEHDRAKTVRPAACVGAGSDYVEKARVSWSDRTARGRGPGGEAIRTGKTVHIEDALADPRMRPWHGAALEHGYRSVVGLPLKDADGEPFGVLLVYSAETEAITPDEVRLLEELAGDLAFGITVLRARTEHARTGELLLRSEEEFRTLAENLPDQITRFDKEGRLQYASPAVLRTYGVRLEDLVGKTTLEIAVHWGPAGDRPEYDAVLLAAQTGLPNSFVANWMTCDGERSIEVRNIPEKAPDGSVLSVLGIARDVTDRTRAEQELRRSEEKYRLIVDTASEGILVVDAHGKLTFVNARMADLVGSSIERMIGRPMSDFVCEDEQDDHAERMRNRERGVSESYERRFLRTDGSQFPALVSATPILDAEQRFTGSFAMCTDITQRKAAESRVHRLNRELTAISNCNQTLLRAADEQALIEDICRVVCEDAGYLMAWVGYAEDDDARSVVPKAWAGAVGDYLEQATISWSDTTYGRGPTGTAIRTGRTVYFHDFPENPNAAPWREAAREHGYRANIALPLKAEDGSTFGAITIYSSEPEAFSAEEVRLLEELAGDLSFGISVLRAREKRRLAEESVRHAALYARNLVEANLDPFAAIDLDGMIADVNEAMEKATGRTRSDLVGTEFAACFTEPAKASEGYRRALEQGVVRDVRLKLRHVSGETLAVIYNATTFADDAGRVQGVLAAARDVTQLEKAQADARNVLLEMIDALALTVEKRDPYTSGHQRRCSQLAVAIAERMGLDETVVEGVRIGAMIHDIGKINVPAEILSKPGSLSPLEWQMITTHCGVGAEIIRGVHAPWPIEQMVLQHHERMDGKGYPFGLHGDEILLEARILAVSDVVEAMASHRPYRPAKGIDAALAEIERGRGETFDADVVDACLAVFREDAFVFGP